MLLLASSLAEARVKIWCFHTAFHAVPGNFHDNHSLLVPEPPFSVVVENLLDPEDMASLLFRISYHQLCPSTPFFWLEIPLKDFHAIHQIKMIGFFFFLFSFVIVLGTADSCSWLPGKPLSISLMCRGWVAEEQGQRVCKHPAMMSAVNSFSRIWRRKEGIVDNPAKLI